MIRVKDPKRSSIFVFHVGTQTFHWPALSSQVLWNAGDETVRCALTVLLIFSDAFQIKRKEYATYDVEHVRMQNDLAPRLLTWLEQFPGEYALTRENTGLIRWKMRTPNSICTSLPSTLRKVSPMALPEAIAKVSPYFLFFAPRCGYFDRLQDKVQNFGAQEPGRLWHNPDWLEHMQASWSLHTIMEPRTMTRSKLTTAMLIPAKASVMSASR